MPYTTKTSEFYFLRIVLALVCAQCESRFSSAIAKVVNRRAAFFFFMIMISSPGIYHAAPAYLPSSFAMYTTMLGFSAFMDIRGGVGIPAGIFWFAGGALLGWPFAGALIIPFVLEQLLLTLYTRKFYAGVKNLLDGALRSVALLVSVHIVT